VSNGMVWCYTHAEYLPHEDFCGCYGRDLTDGQWCDLCWPHVAHRSVSQPWENTYFAQHGEDCPFQVNREGGRP
jgi:hypothetical protein